MTHRRRTPALFTAIGVKLGSKVFGGSARAGGNEDLGLALGEWVRAGVEGCGDESDLTAGRMISNAVITKIGAGGKVCLFTTAPRSSSPTSTATKPHDGAAEEGTAATPPGCLMKHLWTSH